jgi:hypothetical protein
MKKTVLLLLVVGFAFLLPQAAFSRAYRGELHAGKSAVFAGLDVMDYVHTGYFRLGGDVMFYDADDEEYTIIDGRFLVGSETLAPGLLCELGLKVSGGSVENGQHDGDIGAIAFMGRIAYLIKNGFMPVPVRFSATIAGAPDPLSFMDCENYSEVTLDASLFIVENAALVFGYRNYHFEMEDDWKTSEDIFTFGLEVNF